MGNKKECCHGILVTTDCSFTSEDYILDVHTSYKKKQATDTPLYFIATGANEGKLWKYINMYLVPMTVIIKATNTDPTA